MHINFIHELSVIPVAAAAAAAQTLVTTDVVDMQSFDSVAFVAHMGDVSDGSALALTGQAGDESDGSDAANLAAVAAFTAGAADADGKLLILDLHKPRQRYVRATLARAAADAAVNGVMAILYNSHECPLALNGDTVAGVLVNDPAPA